jgi:hypothetical protein
VSCTRREAWTTPHPSSPSRYRVTQPTRLNHISKHFQVLFHLLPSYDDAAQALRRMAITRPAGRRAGRNYSPNSTNTLMMLLVAWPAMLNSKRYGLFCTASLIDVFQSQRMTPPSEMSMVPTFV